MTWATIGFRRRAILQRIADNEEISDVEHWIETGQLRQRRPGPPPEDTPEVHVAREQIRRDGRLIVENVTRAIEQWREQHQTSKPAEPM